MVNEELIQILNTRFQTDLPLAVSSRELLKKLSEFINHLIQTDLQKLLYVLYKIDVSENKLRRMLQENSRDDAALIIASLIIEREQEKIQSRKRFSNNEDASIEKEW